MSLEAQALQIKAALDALKPAHTKTCEWYAGEITAQGLAEELAHPRSIFLAYEGEQTDDQLTEVSTAGEGPTITQVTWRVYCVVSDQRSTKDAILTTGLPGLLALSGEVKAALNRLRFTEAAASDVVSAAHMQFVSERPALFQRGVVLAYMLRFSYLREAEEAARNPLAGTVPFSGLDADINSQPDGTHNPLANSRNRF